MADEKNMKYRELPAVHLVLDWPELHEALARCGRAPLRSAVQRTIENLRLKLGGGEPIDLSRESIAAEILADLSRASQPKLVPAVNATGILVHTNLGRAPLSPEAVRAVATIAGGYSNLEYDLARGERGSRHDHVGELLSEITGAEAAIAVNNNAAAVLLALNTLAEGREAIVSRGELVEIGGSFRIPEIMRKSGCRLVEVGTTNKTRLSDYRAAVTSGTAIFLKVHKSNFRMEGFIEEVSARDLALLAGELGLRVVEDLGSGSLIPLEDIGLAHEPTVRESVESGCDLVTFSGDKLLGGPQAGIIAGRRDPVEACRANPLARALRVDKMTVAALEATLRVYRDPERAAREIPILRAASTPAEEIKRRADALALRLSSALGDAAHVEARPSTAHIGGGALPGSALPSFCVAVTPSMMSVSELEKALREGNPPIVARAADGALLFDLRTLLDGQERVIENALKENLAKENRT